MKLRLVSDGTRAGTFVVDDATNDPVDGVLSVDWRFDTESGRAEGVIRIRDMGADLTGEIRRLIGEA